MLLFQPVIFTFCASSSPLHPTPEEGRRGSGSIGSVSVNAIPKPPTCSYPQPLRTSELAWLEEQVLKPRSGVAVEQTFQLGTGLHFELHCSSKSQTSQTSLPSQQTAFFVASDPFSGPIPTAQGEPGTHFRGPGELGMQKRIMN